jgi:hypothetical protein
MSLVPCNFDSEYREDELTVLSQHLIAEERSTDHGQVTGKLYTIYNFLDC